MYSGLSEPGITAVTAGCDSRNLRKTWAQLVASISAAQPRGCGLRVDQHRGTDSLASGLNRSEGLMRFQNQRCQAE